MKSISNFGVTFVRIMMVLLLMVTGYSCKDVLEATPKGVLSPDQTTTPSAVETLIIAAYQGLSGHFTGNDAAFLGPTSNWINDLRSDDAYKGGGGIADLTPAHQVQTSTLDPTSTVASNKWRNMMLAISRCNFAIAQLGKVNDSKYPTVQRIGEMRLLRGHFHFDMKRNFNKIPYIDEISDAGKVSNTALTSDQVWSKIESDFQFAYDNLPVTQTQIGRVNKYVAAAYLTKLFVETKQWAKAITMADIVIASGKYNLLPNFGDIGKVANDNGPEAVFTVQYSTENVYSSSNYGDLLNVTRSPGINNGGYANGDDFYHGSQNLVNSFRTGTDGLPLFDTFNAVSVLNSSYSGPLDPRIDHTFGRIGIPWKGGTANYTAAWVRDPVYAPGFSGKKNVAAPNEPGINTTFPWAAAGLNYHLIRYSEVLLWKAEALIELNQTLDVARTLINQVRNRAKTGAYVKVLNSTTTNAANYVIDLYPAAGWDQVYARKALRFERRLELAMEGHRIYDLNRWGIAAEVVNAYYASEVARQAYLTGATFVKGKHEYLPIPQGERDLAPTLYEQNDGYK